VGNREIHYELFLMRRAKGEWTLHEAFDSRDAAVEAAKALFESHPRGAVRVEKETYDDGARAFDAVTVFRLGEAAEPIPRARARDENKAEPPCSLAEDLWTVHARGVIARVLDEWLKREAATPLELLHRADLAERLEASPSTVQHAIQKTAIAQASEFESSVQHLVRRLTELAEKAFTRVIEDARKVRLPDVGDSGFAASAAALGEATAYRRCALIADSLVGAKGWRAKIARLLDAADAVAARDGLDAWLDDVDAFLTEALSVREAADQLAQDPEDLGDVLDALVDIIAPQPAHPDNLSAEAARLAGHVRAGRLKGARAALARRVLNDLKRPARLRPGDVWSEMKLSRSLADRLIMLAGPDFPPERTAEAFIYRSGMLVAPEAVEEALATADTAVDALDRLLRMEAAIAGAATKRKLASYIRARLGAHQTESEFVRGPGRPTQRLAQLAALQRKAAASGFCEEDRDEICEAFDRIGARVLEETKLLAALARRDAPPLERAASLLRLASHNVLPEGRCRSEGVARAQALLREAMSAGAPDPALLGEIRDMLGELAA